MGVVSSQLPSLFLAGVPGTLQLPRQGHSWQWLSDCPNTFLGRRGYILHLCWGLGVAEDCIHRNTGEKFKLQKQSSLFWMHFLTELSGPTDTTLNPLSLLSLYALRWQSWSFLLLVSFILPPKMMSFTSSAKSQRLKIYWIQVHVLKLKPPLFSWRSFP